MLTARQELLALVTAQWDRVRTCFSLSSNERFNSIVTTRAILHSFWLSRTSIARSLMTFSLTLVLSTVKHLIAYFVACLRFASTRSLSLFFATEAWQSHHELARSTCSFVTILLALVAEAIQDLSTFIFTSEFSSISYLARSFFLIFSTMTYDCDSDGARRTTTRMAKHLTPTMSAGLVLLLFTVLTTGMRQGHG